MALFNQFPVSPIHPGTTCNIGQDKMYNSPINPLNKSISRQKPNRPRQQSIHSRSQEAIAEEQKTRHESCDMQLDKVVPDAVREHPEGAAASG